MKKSVVGVSVIALAGLVACASAPEENATRSNEAIAKKFSGPALAVRRNESPLQCRASTVQLNRGGVVKVSGFTLGTGGAASSMTTGGSGEGGSEPSCSSTSATTTSGAGGSTSTTASAGTGMAPLPGSLVASYTYGADHVDTAFSDAVGDVRFDGSYSGAPPFAGLPNSGAQSQRFVAELDAQGNVLSASTTSGGELSDIEGHLLDAFSFTGTADFGTGSVTAPPNGHAGYIALRDVNDALLFTRTLSGGVDDQILGSAMGCGRAFVMGATRGGLDAGLGPVLPAGTRGEFVMSFDASGALVAQIGILSSNSILRDISVDAACRPVITGRTPSDSDMSIPGFLAGVDNDSDFVLRLDASLAPLWFNTAGNGGGGQVATNALGEVFAAGRFNEAFSINGVVVATAMEGAYVMKYDLAGNVLWSHVTDVDASPPMEAGFVSKLGLDDAGDAIEAVGFLSNGQSDAFLRVYSPAGVELWTTVLGNAGDDAITSIATGTPGEITVAGTLDGAGWLGTYAE